ncbi:MAG: DUF4065 domain-containing protein [Gracilibacteraceae bacterium]|nr:DUF4065 domain-containing protein [Gracilibacteraceae bacterium]
MCNVFDAASFFIDMANNETEDSMTNLRLNKLLYFAQGLHLARYGIPLFDNDFEAWPYGPVAAPVYEKYKGYGRDAIRSVDPNYYQRLQGNEVDTLLDVFREYGKYTSAGLVKLTHAKSSPWSETCNRSQRGIIPMNEMKEFFSKPEYHVRSVGDDLFLAVKAGKIRVVEEFSRDDDEYYEREIVV